MEMDLLRYGVSFDYDDMATLLIAVAALITVFVQRRSYNKNRTVSETVDAPVLAEFLKLTEKVTLIKSELTAAREEIRLLRVQLDKYVKDEAAYQAELHAKDVLLDELRAKLLEARDERDSLTERIGHLETVLKRAGINGDGV